MIQRGANKRQMEVVLNSEKIEMFGCLAVMEVFNFQCDFYIKIFPIVNKCNERYNAIQIKDGMPYRFEDETLVSPKKTKLVIE